MEFTELNNLFTKVKTLNEVSAWRMSFSTEVQDFIIEANTIDQLYNKGIDALGDSLGEYSAYTITIKQLKGQKTDHITLKDEGLFYKSFDVVYTDTEYKITANSVKEDNDLIDVFGEEIIGLTPENMDELAEIILFTTIEYVKKHLEI